MNHTELQATVEVVQKLVDALSWAQGATDEKTREIQEAYRNGAYWLKEWQASVALVRAPAPGPTTPALELPTFHIPPIPPGVGACPNCVVRQGLGACSTCTIRMHRGIDGMEAWVALALWYIGEVPTTSERENRHLEAARVLLWWAKGHDENLSIPTRRDGS